MLQSTMSIMTRKQQDNLSVPLVYSPQEGNHFRPPLDLRQHLRSPREVKRFQTSVSLRSNGPVLARTTGEERREFSLIPTCRHIPTRVCAVSCQWERLLVSLGQAAIVQYPAACSTQ